MTPSEVDQEWKVGDIHTNSASSANSYSSSTNSAVPFASSLCVVRLERQQLDLPLESRCGRVLVSALKWAAQDQTTGSSTNSVSTTASSSSANDTASLSSANATVSSTSAPNTQSYTDYASIAWLDMDYLAYANNSYDRGRIEVGDNNPPFPPPSSNRLLADIFPLDSNSAGPHYYSRISGPMMEEKNKEYYNIHQLTPPDSAFLLDAVDSLNFRRFHCQGRADQGGCLLEVSNSASFGG